jgi:hypothetical protein
MSDDPLAFLRERASGPSKDKCEYAAVRDRMPDKVRNALLAVEGDHEVQSTRILALIHLHEPKAVGITTIRRHRQVGGCPTCKKESQ